MKWCIPFFHALAIPYMTDAGFSHVNPSWPNKEIRRRFSRWNVKLASLEGILSEITSRTRHRDSIQEYNVTFSNAILHGTADGERRRGKQRWSRNYNIKEWTGWRILTQVCADTDSGQWRTLNTGACTFTTTTTNVACCLVTKRLELRLVDIGIVELMITVSLILWTFTMISDKAVRQRLHGKLEEITTLLTWNRNGKSTACWKIYVRSHNDVLKSHLQLRWPLKSFLTDTW